MSFFPPVHYRQSMSNLPIDLPLGCQQSLLARFITPFLSFHFSLSLSASLLLASERVRMTVSDWLKTRCDIHTLTNSLFIHSFVRFFSRLSMWCVKSTFLLSVLFCFSMHHQTMKYACPRPIRRIIFFLLFSFFFFSLFSLLLHCLHSPSSFALSMRSRARVQRKERKKTRRIDRRQIRRRRKCCQSD